VDYASILVLQKVDCNMRSNILDWTIHMSYSGLGEDSEARFEGVPWGVALEILWEDHQELGALGRLCE